MSNMGTNIQTEQRGRRYAAQKPISLSKYVEAKSDRLAMFVNLIWVSVVHQMRVNVWLPVSYVVHIL